MLLTKSSGLSPDEISHVLSALTGVEDHPSSPSRTPQDLYVARQPAGLIVDGYTNATKVPRTSSLRAHLLAVRGQDKAPRGWVCAYVHVCVAMFTVWVCVCACHECVCTWTPCHLFVDSLTYPLVLGLDLVTPVDLCFLCMPLYCDKCSETSYLQVHRHWLDIVPPDWYKRHVQEQVFCIRIVRWL